jgi:hypothetical protein
VVAFFRCAFYSTFCILGYKTLFDPDTAEWVVDTDNHWNGWPYHQISKAALFYYHIELGSYIHQLIFSEVHHSDFLEMTAHHIITILLIVTSYITNFWRVGTSILLLHDMADVILEGAKVLNYTSRAPGRKWIKDYLVDPGFGLFTVTFFITRLYLYPRYIICSVLGHGYALYGCEWGGCYVFVGLLLSLQGLHIFWFYLIMRMVYRLCTIGIEGDVRSEDDEGDDEKPEVDTKKEQ